MNVHCFGYPKASNRNNQSEDRYQKARQEIGKLAKDWSSWKYFRIFLDRLSKKSAKGWTDHQSYSPRSSYNGHSQSLVLFPANLWSVCPNGTEHTTQTPQQKSRLQMSDEMPKRVLRTTANVPKIITGFLPYQSAIMPQRTEVKARPSMKEDPM